MLVMGYTFVISGLKDKRARLAGEVAATQALLDQRRAELAQIDAVIRMFTPDCHPDMIPPIRPAGRRDLFFSYRELPRMCLDILRNADKPLRLDHIAVQIGMLKGFDLAGPMRRHVTNSARALLVRMEAKGMVRRIVNEPEPWWELA